MDQIQILVYSTASSKYTKTSSKELWDMSWEEFEAEVTWVKIAEAGAIASTMDASSN